MTGAEQAADGWANGEPSQVSLVWRFMFQLSEMVSNCWSVA